MAQEYDVIVVGAGNAALSAAIAARETCQSVLVVEKAPNISGAARYESRFRRTVSQLSPA